jgi:hypothetical protein
MYNLIFSAILGIAALSPGAFNGDTPPVLVDFQTEESVEVLHLGVEKNGSEVSLTILLQIDDSVLAVTSTSHSYVDATDQLNQVIKAAAKK